MLAPEVWNFEPPANLLKVKEGFLDTDNSVLEQTIKSHHFNHLVSVVLPDNLQVPESVHEALTTDSDYYKINKLPVYELLAKEFIDAFVKKGHLTVLSVDTRIDLDNCIALVGSGHLVLSLNRNSYQKLGLEGKPTLTKTKPHQRYIVTIDLNAEHFLPGRKHYDHIIKNIRNNLQAFDLILTWDSGDEKVCPSSVASYLDQRGYETKVCKPQLGHRTEYNVKVPIMIPKEAACSVEDLFEWLGAFSLNRDRSDIESGLRYSSSETEFLSSFSTPQDHMDCGQVAFLLWKGLFSSTQIIVLYQKLRDFMKGREDIPWASLYVQGFSDSPVCWGLKEHTFYTDGDNSYTILIKPDNTYAMATLYSNHRLIK